jgi:hypothetical protein
MAMNCTMHPRDRKADSWASALVLSPYLARMALYSSSEPTLPQKRWIVGLG